MPERWKHFYLVVAHSVSPVCTHTHTYIYMHLSLSLSLFLSSALHERSIRVFRSNQPCWFTSKTIIQVTGPPNDVVINDQSGLTCSCRLLCRSIFVPRFSILRRFTCGFVPFWENGPSSSSRRMVFPHVTDDSLYFHANKEPTYPPYARCLLSSENSSVWFLCRRRTRSLCSLDSAIVQRSRTLESRN